MSKVFEALQRLERESGKPPVGVSNAAQEVFRNGGSSGIVSPEEGESEEKVTAAPIAAEVPPRSAESAFQIEQVPVQDVTITAETRIVYFTDPNSSGADRFRLLRMRLWPLWEGGKLRKLLITSAQLQDGKSTVTLNLATALAEKGKRKVLVIEGDLVHPTIANRLGLPDLPGLAECLELDPDPTLLLQRLEPLGWYLLPAGRPRGNPTELLQSPLLANVFDVLRPHFDWILVDSAPVIPLTDTLSFRQHVDAGLLVVRAERTPRDAVEAAIGRVGPQNLLGIILNGAQELDRLYSNYGKSYDVQGRGKE